MRVKLNTIPKTLKLNGKRVLLRVDFNVPLKKIGKLQKVADTARLRHALPTIVRLSKAGAQLILVTHVGEPNGKIITKLRVRPIIDELARLLPDDIPRPKSIYHW